MFTENSNPCQLDWIRLPRIPLTDVDIFILIYADIVAMLENRFVLKHNLQNPIVVMRL